MEWTTSTDGASQAMAGDGSTWVIRESVTVGGCHALFRLAPGVTLADEVDEEEQSCAILRSHGEARIMAGFLDGRRNLPLSVPSPFLPTYEGEGGRRSWRMGLPDGFVSLHLGSDEDARDVIAQRFSRRTPGEIQTFLLVTHGKAMDVPEGWSPMAAAVALFDLIQAADRFDEPLDEEDARLWAVGLPVRSGGPVKDLEVDGTSSEIVETGTRLEAEGFESPVLLEMAKDILQQSVGDDAGRLSALSKWVSVQYALVAAVHGKEVADAVVQESRSPAP